MIQQQAETYTLAGFGEDVRRVLTKYGEAPEGILRLGLLLQRLAKEGGDLWQLGEPTQGSSGLPARTLYRDPDQRFVLLLVQFRPNTPTAIHSHEGWVVTCVLSGSDHHTTWRRVEEESTASRVKLEVAQDHHMFPGEIGYLFNDPYNIHRNWAGSEGVTEIHLAAGRGRRLYHIDEATGQCYEAPSLGR
jgi:hypothetical protein